MEQMTREQAQAAVETIYGAGAAVIDAGASTKKPRYRVGVARVGAFNIMGDGDSWGEAVQSARDWEAKKASRANKGKCS